MRRDAGHDLLPVTDPLGRRGRRVAVLLAGVVVLSFADLVLTVTHLRTIGMVEANPLAAWLIRTTGSPWALAGYKTVTVAICVALLYRVRRYRSGEIASWVAVLILVGLSVLWHTYSSVLESPAELRSVQVEHGHEWLHLD